MSPKSYRVLLVDEHAIVRRGVKASLKTEPEMVVSGEAEGGQEALDQVRRTKLDMVVLETTLAGANGFELIAAIHRLSPGVEILVFTILSSADAARAAFGAGARGYALKSDSLSEFIRAVRNVRQHKPYITPQLTPAVPRDSTERLSRPQLTGREAVVMKLLANGFGNKHIALVLGISRRTVEAHRQHIMQKLRCQSFSDLIRFALRQEETEQFVPGAGSRCEQRPQGLPGARVPIPRGAFGKIPFCPESTLASIRIDRNKAPQFPTSGCARVPHRSLLCFPLRAQ